MLYSLTLVDAALRTLDIHERFFSSVQIIEIILTSLALHRWGCPRFILPHVKAAAKSMTSLV